MKILIYAALVCAQLALSVCKPRVVCYYPDYRLGSLSPKDFDATLCTHIHFSFHKLDEGKNVIVDGSGTAKPDLYKSLKDLKTKNKDLKIIVASPGAGAPDESWSKMVTDAKLRAAFIKNTVAYLKKYGFDGFDLDWEFPVCYHGDCTKGHATDKANFGKLATELRAAFDKESPKLSLSAAVQAGLPGGAIDKGYDIPALSKALDYLCVMTYDLAGVWDQKTGHHSDFKRSTEWSKSYVEKGFPKEKVLVGVAFYGRGYTLKDAAQHATGAPIAGVGNTPGGADGTALYSEMCDLVKNKGWKKERANGKDPFAYNGKIWFGYDDPYQAFDKAAWVKANGYGGIIMWEVGQDDVKGTCCSVKFPMLRAINNGLFGTGKAPDSYGCEKK